MPGPIAGGALDTIALPALTRTRAPGAARAPCPARRGASRAACGRSDRARRRRTSTATSSPRAAPRVGPLPRVLAALAAGGLSAAALALLGPQPPLEPAAGAALAGAAVLLLPRLGWLVAGRRAAGLARRADAGRRAARRRRGRAGGAAARAPRDASGRCPRVAPLLGLIGLAGAWPALAGQPSRWQVRAVLGALGGWWLALGELLTLRAAHVRPRPRRAAARGPGRARRSTRCRTRCGPCSPAARSASSCCGPLAALLLPLLVRGRSAALDIVAVTGWAAALAAATQALSEALVLDPPRGLVLGALAGGVVAVAARAVRGRA